MIPVPYRVLEKLAAAYKTSANQLKKFGGGSESSDGIVYAYPQGDALRLIKIMAIPIAEQRVGLLCLEERLRFVRYLGENGARIVFPNISPGGNFYETYADEKHLWVGYSMDLIPGRRQPEKSWNPAFFRNWGQTVGLCNRLAKGYSSWKASIDPETGKELLTWRAEWESFYDWCQDEEVKAKWVEIRDSLDALPVNREVFGFTHNDPHIWNLLVDGDRITLLDFDVANHHWFINDIAIACQNILMFHSGGLNSRLHRLDKLEAFLGYFMQGYRRENDLPLEWLRHLDLFFAYRRIMSFIVMNNWIRSRPKLYRTWKRLILTQPEILGN
jgi:Ser/Thr protein kinase RdoA (MazF antagonist)